MIKITIINSMSVNPVSNFPPRSFRNDGLPVRLCESIFNVNSISIYQSEYLVPSSAVPPDFE